MPDNKKRKLIGKPATFDQRREGPTRFSVGVVLTIALLAALTGLTAYAVVRDRPKAAGRITPQVSQQAIHSLDQMPVQNRPGEVELISLTPSGFEPAEISRSTGRFLFGINNRTSFSDLTFQVVDEGGVVVAEQRVARVRVGRKVIDPAPGRYLVRVVGHPDWRCLITISRQ